MSVETEAGASNEQILPLANPSESLVKLSTEEIALYSDRVTAGIEYVSTGGKDLADRAKVIGADVEDLREATSISGVSLYASLIAANFGHHMPFLVVAGGEALRAVPVARRAYRDRHWSRDGAPTIDNATRIEVFNAHRLPGINDKETPVLLNVKSPIIDCASEESRALAMREAIATTQAILRDVEYDGVTIEDWALTLGGAHALRERGKAVGAREFFADYRGLPTRVNTPLRYYSRQDFQAMELGNRNWVVEELLQRISQRYPGGKIAAALRAEGGITNSNKSYILAALETLIDAQTEPEIPGGTRYVQDPLDGLMRERYRLRTEVTRSADGSLTVSELDQRNLRTRQYPLASTLGKIDPDEFVMLDLDRLSAKERMAYSAYVAHALLQKVDLTVAEPLERGKVHFYPQRLTTFNTIGHVEQRNLKRKRLWRAVVFAGAAIAASITVPAALERFNPLPFGFGTPEYEAPPPVAAEPPPPPAPSFDGFFSSPVGFGKASYEVNYRVEEHGLDSEGLYGIRTLDTLENNTWTDNDPTLESEISLPNEISSSTPHLLLEQYFSAEEFGDDSNGIFILLAEKIGTQAGSIKLVNEDGEPVPFSLYRMPDNALTLKIPAGVDFEYTHLTYSLVESEERLFAQSVLETEALDAATLHLDGGITANGSSPASLAATMAETFDYEVDSVYADELENASSNTEYLNSLLERQECDCDVCNTGVALLSSQLNPDSYFNLTTGYYNNGAINQLVTGESFSFLESTERHGWVVDQNGNIYDGTPSALGENQATLDAQESDADSSAAESAWNTRVNEIIGKPPEFISKAGSKTEIDAGMYASLGVSALLLGGFALAGGSAVQSLHLHRRKNRLGAFLAERELTLPYHVLEWISYAEPSATLTPEILKTMAAHNGKNSHQYLKMAEDLDPSQFVRAGYNPSTTQFAPHILENDIDRHMPMSQRRTMRNLARYAVIAQKLQRKSARL